MLKRLYLSCEVNFTFEKLLSHNVLLVRIFVDRFSILRLLLHPFSSVGILRGRTALISLILKLIRAWLYDAALIFIVLVLLFLCLVSWVLFQVVVRYVASLLFLGYATNRISESGFCQNHFLLSKFFSGRRRRLVRGCGNILNVRMSSTIIFVTRRVHRH